MVPTCELARQDARVPGPKAVVTTEIGKRIHERLQMLGWSMRRLASEAGVSASMLTNWCKEERREKAQVDIDKVAEALGVSGAWLARGWVAGQMQASLMPADSTPFEIGLRLFLAGPGLSERIAFAAKVEAMAFSGAKSGEDIANALEAQFAISKRIHGRVALDEPDDDPPPKTVARAKPRR